MAYQHDLVERVVEDRKPLCALRPPRPGVDSPLWGEAYAYLRGRGLSPELAFANGWYPYETTEALYLVIPAESPEPGNRWWQARLVRGHGARWHSPSGCRRGVAWGVVRPVGPPVGTVLAEGAMDALAVAEVGWEGIALMGAQPPRPVLEALARAPLRAPIVLVPDRDAVGTWGRVAMYFAGAAILLPSRAKDLAELPADQRRDVLAPFAHARG
ncbi:MAG: toprim domain-containing protein [Armatimonadota bacterium]|nr:toprim domain-containing protein [Armatimonadota bacterium]